MPGDAQSDSELVRGALAGRQHDFGLLVERYLPLANAIARATVRQPEEVEDIVQESLLKAYRKLDTLKRPERFCQWLCAIVRNACVQHVRSSHRRRTVQLDEARDEAFADPRVERRELYALLRREVRGLPLKHREILLMHYFADLPTPRIAVALGISNAAAKKRLQRARAALGLRLTETLSEMAPDDGVARQQQRARTMSAIAATGVPWQGTATAKAAATLPLWGGLLMTKKGLIASAAVAVLFCVLIGQAIDGMRLTNAERPQARADRPAPAPLPSPAPHSDEAAAGGHAAEEPAHGAPGREKAGELLAKAFRQHEERTARRTAGRAERGVAFGGESPEAPGARDGEGPTGIEGVVVDAHGAPVAGARIYAYRLREVDVPPGPIRTRSRADGCFAIRDLAPAGQRVVAMHDDYAPGWATARAGAGSDAGEVRIALTGGGTVTGRVTADGRAWPDLPIRLRQEWTLREGATDAQGWYTIEHVPAGEYEVRAQSAVKTARVTEAGTTRVDFDLTSRVGDVEGTVYAENQAAVGGRLVLVVTTESGDMEVFNTSIDEAGRYRYGDVPVGRGTLQVEARMPDGALLTKAVAVRIAHGETTVKDVVFSHGASIDARVLAPEGSTFSGLLLIEGEVALTRLDSQSVMEFFPHVVAQVTEGERRFEGLDPGTYTVLGFVQASGDPGDADWIADLPWAAETVDVAPGAEVAVTLRPR